MYRCRDLLVSIFTREFNIWSTEEREPPTSDENWFVEFFSFSHVVGYTTCSSLTFVSGPCFEPRSQWEEIEACKQLLGGLVTICSFIYCELDKLVQNDKEKNRRETERR